MGYQIVTDSACNLLETTIDELELHILPLTFLVDGESEPRQSYLKGETTDLKQFYTMMREDKVITTSLPNIGDSEKTIRAILDAGEDVLYLGFSSGLSGTYEATASLCNDLAKEYPGRTIRAVDTLTAAMGQGVFVYYAAKMRLAGKDINEVAQWVLDNRLNMAHWFTVEDLKYLYRGGRVSRTTAFAAGMLNIKPVMHVDNEGKLVAMGKARGRKKSLQALVQHMKDTAIAPVQEQVIGISHGDCEDDVEYLKKLLVEEYGELEFLVNCLDPVIGAHAGPGTMALFFLASER